MNPPPTLPNPLTSSNGTGSSSNGHEPEPVDEPAFPELPDTIGDPPAIDVRRLRSYLSVWAERFAGAGLPTVHAPRDVPLEPERAAEAWHAGDQHRTAQWAARARKEVEALRTLVGAREAHFVADAESTGRDLERVEEEIEQHEVAITGSQPGRQFERLRSSERSQAIFAPLLLLVPEYFVIAPAIGETQDLGGTKLVLTVLSLSLSQVFLAEVTGGLARQWRESTAARRDRRFKAIMVGLCAALIAGSQMGIALARWGAGEGTATDLLLSLGTQFAVVALSVAVGWYRTDPPEVANRRALAGQAEHLVSSQVRSLEASADARRELEVLDSLVAGWPAWLRDRQAAIREIYAHELLTFRAQLRVGLEERQHVEPAYVLTEVAEPVLEVPVTPVGLDEDDDLLAGPSTLDLTI